MRVVALSEIQRQHFEEPTVVIAQTVGGMEDIPVRVPCANQCCACTAQSRRGMLTHLDKETQAVACFLLFEFHCIS